MILLGNKIILFPNEDEEENINIYHFLKHLYMHFYIVLSY